MSHAFPRHSVNLIANNIKKELKQSLKRCIYSSAAPTKAETIPIAPKKTDKVLLKHLLGMKKRKEPISMITCYDTSQAVLADISCIDTVLVGDSCANVMMGLKNTNQISIDAIIHHTQSVSRGLNRAYLIADMPFGSYLTVSDGIKNAARLIGEGGASCVKLEGFMPDIIREISKFIPVCGHLGLLPQTHDCFGTRGRTYKDIKELARQALALQEAGASMLVLEKVCSETAAYISSLLEIPTIGIGSGPHCDGQVLVWHDMLGLGHPDNITYKFVKKYANIAPNIVNAIQGYIGDVKDGSFPAPKNSYYLPEFTKEKLNNDHEIWREIDIDIDNVNSFWDKIKYMDYNKRTDIIKSASEIRKRRNEIYQSDDNREIIFIPFLGGLHDGHLSLIKEAKKYEATHQIWCSLFLNPLQFNDINDYLKYPYSMNDDIEKLESLGVDVIFVPDVNDMYPFYDINTNTNNNSLFGAYVDFENISIDCDEGISRPGHFKGVGTVVTKLFSWIRPDKAIFGQKDFMQCIIIKNLCKEFFPDIDIIIHETCRDNDGLAMSSRNDKLSIKERERAPLIYQCLCGIASKLFDTLNESANININQLRQIGEKYAEINDVKLEYISFHDFNNGIKLEKIMDENDGNNALKSFIDNNEMVISIAGSVGDSTRLIDNIVIGGKDNNKTLWNGVKYINIDQYK